MANKAQGGSKGHDREDSGHPDQGRRDRNLHLLSGTGGPYPPVLFLMDAPGIREELYEMARRLATVGYYVLLPNLYYRAGKDTKYGADVLERAAPSRPACGRCAPR